MNTITPGVASLLRSEKQKIVVLFVAGASVHFELRARGEKSLPSMIVARPGAKVITKEDRGTTLVVPIPDGFPKLYAIENETGGVSVMLADEY